MGIEKINMDGPQETWVPATLDGKSDKSGKSGKSDKSDKSDKAHHISTPSISEKKSRKLWAVDPVLAPEYELNMRYTQGTADGPKVAVPTGTPTPTGAESTLRGYDKPRIGPTNYQGTINPSIPNLTTPVQPPPFTKGYDPIVGGNLVRVNDERKLTTINRGQQG